MSLQLHSKRKPRFLTTLLASFCFSNVLISATLSAAESISLTNNSHNQLFENSPPPEPEENIEFSYGPPPSVPRGTLFQWSYGTSFSGGPNLDEPLVTDRPDFTEASSTVGRGVAQLEFGYTYVEDTAGGVKTREQSFGEPLLRYGILADWLEFRLAVFPSEQRISSGGASNSTAGIADLYTGFKIGLTPQEGILPEMALVPQMTLPTGSTAFTSGQVEPGVNWLYGWDINDFLAMGGSTQGNQRVDETGGTYLEMAQSWTICYSFTERLGGYTEWFAILPSGADTALPEYYFDGGFTYVITNDVQFDIRGGVGLNDSAADYFLGTGLAVRFR